MTALLSAVLVGFGFGGLLIVVSAFRHPRQDLAPEKAEHWLVEHLAARPRLRRLVAGLDRRVVGGASLAIALTIVTLSGAAVGSVFDSLDTNRGFARWDESVANWGAENATATSTSVLDVVTHGGSSIVLLPLMALVGVFDFVRRRRWVIVGFLATAGIGVVIVNNVLKLVVGRERPPVEHLVSASGSSFPSGHSAAAAACWAAMALVLASHVSRRRRPLLTAAAAVVAVSVAASRALLGVHWLTDVLAGLVVGWSWFVLAAMAFGGRIVRLGHPVTEIEEAQSPTAGAPTAGAPTTGVPTTGETVR